MAQSSGILFQDNSYCLSCWNDPKQRFSSVVSGHLVASNERQSHEKKVSLRNYNHSRMKQSQLKLPVNQAIVLENYSKTARVFEPSCPEQKVINSPIKITFLQQPKLSLNKQRLKHPFQESSLVNFHDRKPIKSTLSTPESKILTKTTKLERILPTKNEELQKTKKNIQFHQVVHLADLKQSVCSFTESYNQEEKLEESEILMDYFHPSEKRMSEIEHYIESKGLSQSVHQS